MFIVTKCAAALGVLGRDAQGNIIEGYVIKSKQCRNSAEVEALRECWGEIKVEFQPSPTRYFNEHRA